MSPDPLARPEFLPDPDRSRGEMESLQRELAAEATFVDDLGFGPDDVAIDEAVDLSAGLPPAVGGGAATLSDGPGDPHAPVVVGVDGAFRPEHDEAVSAAVAIRDGTVVEYAHAVTPLSIPYVPGLLAFREGEPVLAVLEALSVTPDLLVCDGSGRIHFRQAGIATHVGVIRDLPSVGVAKNLLCGEPDEPVGERPEGWSTPIRADDSVERIDTTAGGGDGVGEGDADGVDADDGTVIGHAYQSRQYPNSRRVNPLYVSPGHRVSAETTVDLVSALCAGYKLPEPTRLADAHADRVKRRLEEDG
ncbi:endonuclease V [Halorubrum sp. 48-1-W]|uniref:endonuclease V n=1 Tax=Halorubrum sp. 48-1-W TaxID=2249761 RepID=UPI000DCB110B|nr:endonuclease V [Halorubrum sp. 48-1-W]RAW44672.1 endonuclease V [Halorubrum sp. 48-1-W]